MDKRQFALFCQGQENLIDKAIPVLEDPYTDTMISSFPIVLTALDSRYEYDLNRTPENCIYDEAWGLPVWQEELSEELKASSVAKHATYYRVLKALLKKIKELFGSCLVLDLHSYNWQIPVFILRGGMK